MKAEIVTIGDELLIGQVIDTNSAYLAAGLSKLGFEVKKIHSIPDQHVTIINTLDNVIKNTDLVILTGGLGPTKDDITKSALLSFFGGEMRLDRTALEHIKKFLKSRKLKLSERNKKQAEVPSTCDTLVNGQGSAPGMVFRKNTCMVVSLPGVPFEVKDIFECSLTPILEREFKLPVKLQKTLLIEGIPEGFAADRLHDWENKLAKDTRLAYLPSPGLLRLRLSVSGDNKDQLIKKLNASSAFIINTFGREHVFGQDKETLQLIVGEQLMRKGKTLAIAESCTGGYIAHLITSVPGSSKYFTGSITAYSNEVKINQLGVDKEDVLGYGAVSQQVVEQMAVGVRQQFNTDFSIATSGIAGPDGGTIEKPVGTTWIAVSSVNNLVSKKFLHGEHRGRNITKASLSALNMLRNMLLESE